MKLPWYDSYMLAPYHTCGGLTSQTAERSLCSLESTAVLSHTPKV